MPSQAFQSFVSAIDEIEALGTASRPSLTVNRVDSLRMARAVGRGQIVLLSAHFERYIYALNEELVTFINSQRIHGHRLADILRLQHSMTPIESLALTGWDRRATQLAEFVFSDAWLWTVGSSGTIAHTRLLTWMRAPNPRSLVRYFSLWGIQDIFTAITRKPTSRQAFWLSVQGLVDLRNNIAHGDYLAQATQADVKEYVKRITEFCNRTDRKIASVIRQRFGITAPW